MCPQCSKYLGEYSNTVNSKKVCTCDSIVDGSAIDSLFIDINIESQIRKLFANPVVQKYLEHQPQQNQNDDTFKDVFDGKVHKEYEKKDGKTFDIRYKKLKLFEKTSDVEQHFLDSENPTKRHDRHTRRLTSDSEEEEHEEHTNISLEILGVPTPPGFNFSEDLLQEVIINQNRMDINMRRREKVQVVDNLLDIAMMDSFSDKFPLKTLAEFYSCERELANSVTYVTQCRNFLMGFGASDGHFTTRTILHELLTDDLAMKFNLSLYLKNETKKVSFTRRCSRVIRKLLSIFVV
ncbi:hypothetical protein TKK_0013791 [Trichogramma kaykai]